MPEGKDDQQQTEQIMQVAHRGIGTVDGDDEYDASNDEEQKGDGEQKRYATLFAKPFAEQALVPRPVMPNMEDAEDEEQNGCHNVCRCPLFPYLMGRIFPCHMKTETRYDGCDADGYQQQVGYALTATMAPC